MFRHPTISSWSTPDDTQLAATLQRLIDGIDTTVLSWADAGVIVGYNVRFDLAHCEHHARRLGLTWPDIDKRRYGNRHVLDVYELLAGDDCEHVISRSLTSACRVYGVDVPEDDATGGSVASLYAANDWDGLHLHCTRDVERVVALARRVGLLPKRYLALDIETVADPRTVVWLKEVEANRTLRDPAKIEADLSLKRAAQTDKMALDPWASVPIVIAWETDLSAARPALSFDQFLTGAVRDSVDAR